MTGHAFTSDAYQSLIGFEVALTVLEPRQRRLAHQIGPRIGAAAAGNLQGGIGLELFHVDAVLVACLSMRARAMSA